MQINGSSIPQTILQPTQIPGSSKDSEAANFNPQDSVTISPEASQLADGSLREPAEKIVNPPEPPYP